MNKHKELYKGHNAVPGIRRKVAVARRIAIPVETQTQYEYAVVRLEKMTQDMKKALRQKASFISKKYYLDFLIHDAGQDLKSFANDDNNSFHYKGVK